MAGVNGNSELCSLSLYLIQMLKVAVLADFGTQVAALRGYNLVFDLGFRRLIPNLEQVTFKVPRVTPICAAIISGTSPRAMRSLIC
jgi:hypothetical protein